MITAWAAHFPWDPIRAAAGARGLDALLVGAFVGQESEGVALKTRYEKNYQWVVKPDVYAASLGITVATEMLAQMHSYGLMQIMGGTARSLGFNGYLAQLVDPAVGLHWACDYLSLLKAKYGKIQDVIASYNAGSPRDVAPADGIVDNHAYVDGVLAKYAELQRDSARVLS